MKKLIICITGFFAIAFISSCKKEGNYPGGSVSPYISMFDLREIYKGEDITLTKDNMFGADKIAGVVVSDHTGGNVPAGLVVIQDSRRLGRLRGVSIAVGADAANYVPGDSLIVSVEGGVLKRVDGILQLTGITTSKINKVATGRPLSPLVVKSNLVLQAPEEYESVYISIAKAGFDPSLPPGSTYSGDRVINDGFGNLVLHTEPGASWAGNTLPFLSNFSGIVFNASNGEPRLWPRKASDIVILSATAPKIAGIVVTGFLADVGGTTVTDANYEYIQLMATRNIDFSVTPFSIVTTNNAGANTPTGFPANGWATGDLRTYKFNLTSGTVSAGQHFYIGANKNLNGPGSPDISSALWFGKMYSTIDGDGFGTKTTNLLANSGNGAGIAVFDKIAVDETTVPVDVIFYGGGGNLYTAGPPARGYRITNTDYYDEKNPITLVNQPFFNQGSNTGKFAFPTGSNFAKLTGTYNTVTGRWSSARVQSNVPLPVTATLADIEGGVTLEQ